MSDSYQSQVYEYLRILADFESTTQPGQAGFHEYYEKAGYASTRIEQMGADAVPDLITALSDTNDNIRRHAVLLLRQIGDKRGIEPLRTRLKAETDPNIRQLVENTLVQMGALDEREVLEEHLRSDDVQRRYEAVGKIVSSGEKAYPTLLLAMKDEATEVRQIAINAIGPNLKEDPAVIELLIDVMKSDDLAVVRMAAVRSLAANVSDPEKILAELKDATDSEIDSDVLRVLITIRNQLGDTQAADILLNRLQTPSTAEQAAHNLMKISKQGGLSDATIADLIAWLDDAVSPTGETSQDSMTLYYVSEALIVAGASQAADPIARYIAAVADQQSYRLIQRLPKLPGDDGQRALLSLLEHKKPIIRHHALTALREHPYPAALDALQRHLTDENLSEFERGLVEAAIKAI